MGGIDYAVRQGTPIPAPCNGTVENIANFSGFGNYVRFHHDADTTGVGAGWRDEYLHLKDGGFVPAGKYLQGQTIGYSGSTGNSTGPHIHHHLISPDGVRVNPLLYINSQGTNDRKKTMFIVNNGKDEFVIGQEYIHHVSGPAEEAALKKVLGEVQWIGGEEFNNVLRGLGVPLDKPKAVLGGKTWSRTAEVQQGGTSGSFPTTKAIAKEVNDDAARRLSA